MSQSHILTLMVTIPLILSQTVRGENCVCELQNSDPAFPENKLNHVDFTAIQCARNVTSEKMTEIDRLVLGLQHRIRQLLDNVSMLEREDNGNLYAAVSLRIIELELAEIQDLLDKLNQTTNNYQQLSVQAAEEFQDMMDTMTELEKFDHVQVMVKQRENELIKRDLERCKEELNSTSPAPTLFPGHCGLGHVVNVSVPKTYSLTEYGTSYTYGAWGRDANPAPGNENKYWLVVLTSSNAYGNFIRQYSSLSAIMLDSHDQCFESLGHYHCWTTPAPPPSGLTEVLRTLARLCNSPKMGNPGQEEQPLTYHARIWDGSPVEANGSFSINN
ncbi:hypothetical protein Q8A67_025185 [Cirrhinus molitorella]|uniref:Uncharacterized protein n=1 Tax=Cirrhinus molitorella TaxID=172907 RepID=A0AA88NZA1_9TELE|nr:hypothetical protein Q8A67_025185 [Cirrhinus molitorella]